MLMSEYFNRFFASRMTNESIHSWADLPLTDFMSLERYFGVR